MSSSESSATGGGGNSNIMTVGEMIDTAFGEREVNTVDHKLIQTILYLLARQLRILERRVRVEIGPALQPSSSSLSVTEVKVHAMQKKKKKLKGTTVGGHGGRAGGGMGGVGMGGGGIGGVGMGGGGMGGGRIGGGRIGGGGGGIGGGGGMGTGGIGAGGMGAGGMGGAGHGQGPGRGGQQGGRAPGKTSLSTSLSDKTTTDRTSSNKTSSDKTSSDKTSSDKTSTDKTSTDKTSSDKTSTDKTSTDKTSADKTSTDKTSTDKTSSDKTSTGKTSSDKTSTDKTSSDKTSSDKTSTDKTSTDKTSTDKTSTDKTSTDKTSSDKISTDKTSTYKTSTDKTSSDKTSSDKTSSDKTSTDKTSSDKTSSDKTSTDKSSSDKTATDKTSSDKTSSDKTSSDKTSSDKTSTDKTSSGKTTSDKISSDKTSSDKTSSGKTSTDKTSSDKTSTDKTSSDKTSTDKTSTDKTSSDKTSSDKTSSDKTSTKTSTEPTSSDKTSSKSPTDKSTSEKTSTDKSSSGKTTTGTTSSSRKGPGDYAKLLEAIEEQREEELRVIRQRTDSREDHESTPSPMASMDSMEATYEKLLVVQRIPADEAKTLATRGRTHSRDKMPQISVVTLEQFQKLATTVGQLQEKFGPVGSATFPENIQLMQELRKGASLTDAMAALQLSARLEATEKALEQMTSLITDLASKTPGIDLTDGTAEDVQVIFGASGGKSPASGASRKTQRSHAKKELSPEVTSSDESIIIPLPPQSIVEMEAVAPSAATGGTEETEKEQPDRITYEELDNAIQDLHDEIIKTVNNLTAKSTVNADNAYQIASKLEGKLEASLNLGTKMQDLEALVSDYSEQINILDTSLSSQMTNYQEELTQMQHDLETALETMAEVLANAGGDTTAVAELNAQFSNLQSDIDDTMMRQKELKNNQNSLAFDLESLRKQIEILRETKSDREEVADALRDKAGLGALNGLVPLQQFDAVRGDMEKRIGSAYDKFNSQETIWQKVIDDLLRELNEKADWIQVVSLKEDVNRHLETLRCRLNAMLEIVGEPRAGAVAKKLHRDTTCLSCATPADLELEEHGAIPALPALRPPAIGAEASLPKADGDHGPCFPGLAIPHPRDPRSHVCQRWCGGSHTKVPNTVSRGPVGMIITPAVRKVATALGTDGKTYMVDETMKPCAQCIVPKTTTPQPSISEHNHDQEEDIGSCMTPPDFQQSLTYALPENETPPPPEED